MQALRQVLHTLQWLPRRHACTAGAALTCLRRTTSSAPQKLCKTCRRASGSNRAENNEGAAAEVLMQRRRSSARPELGAWNALAWDFFVHGMGSVSGCVSSEGGWMHRAIHCSCPCRVKCVSDASTARGSEVCNSGPSAKARPEKTADHPSAVAMACSCAQACELDPTWEELLAFLWQVPSARQQLQQRQWSDSALVFTAQNVQVSLGENAVMKFGPALAAGPSHRRRVVWLRSRHCRSSAVSGGKPVGTPVKTARSGGEGGGCVEAHANRVVAMS